MESLEDHETLAFGECINLRCLFSRVRGRFFKQNVFTPLQGFHSPLKVETIGEWVINDMDLRVVYQICE